MADIKQALERAAQVKARFETELLSKANVVGVGVGFVSKAGQLLDQVGIVVNVRRKVPLDELAAEDVIPAELEGTIVDVNEVGEIRAL
jgi:hypothetical protein